MRTYPSAAILIFGLTLATVTLTTTATAAEQFIIQFTPEAISATGAEISPADSLALTPSLGMGGFAAATPPADLWERIRSGFTMAELNSKEVRRSEAFYARNPEHLNRIVERSKRYLFHIVEEVERRGMPTEIALLPIIESAFNPTAYSRSHASGIWQFIPSTGKSYGLKQNWWHDDRRDIVAATSAALDYLQNLHGMFGDWELALASYNWGEGAVGRSLTKNRNKGLPLDFRNLSMPRETQHYVPKLIAMRNIISNPAAYGVVLESIPNQPYFEQIKTTQHIDVKLVASLADISVDEFNALNPAHNRPVINVNGSRTLLLPVDKVEIFAANLENHAKPLVSWQAYQAKQGETAEKIAARHGISVARLKEVNGVAKHRNIAPGQTLLVPLSGGETGMGLAAMANKPVEPRMLERNLVYAVRKGDTLAAIAKRHNVSVAQIQSWNSRTDRLVIGQNLVLKKTTSGTIQLAKAPVKKRATPAKKSSVILADANQYIR